MMRLLNTLFRKPAANDSNTPEEHFWAWFIKNDNLLFDFEVDQERIFDKIAAELQKVERELCFEFGPKEEHAGRETREFVISAGGIREAFPSVVALAKVAPKLDRWRVTAFRPRRWPPNIVEFGGRRIDPRDVCFELLVNGKTIGLNLLIPDFDESTELKMIGFLMLDETIGEYDVGDLGLIEMKSLDASPVGVRHPLEKLPMLFDKLALSLQGRAGQPS